MLAFARGLTIDIPALYMVGERDVVMKNPFIRDILANMTNLVPKLTQTIELPGCGHWTQQERPAEINAAIIDFANELINKA